MELEPITRQEKIIAGQDLTPITRMEMFLKNFGGGGGGSGGSSGGVTTLHINVTAINGGKATFTADKTPSEMSQAAATGPIWCVVTFAAGVMSEEALSLGIPPACKGIYTVAFGSQTLPVHRADGENDVVLVVSGTPVDGWIIDLAALAGD